MAHWRLILPPDSFLEVRYEDVVDDIDAEARRLIAYCGLPWDERCLDFHQNNRPVHTVSAAQVRQPLFRHSLGRGQKYHQRLDMLLGGIGGDGIGGGVPRQQGQTR